MRENKILIVSKKPGEAPTVTYVANNLPSMQALVDGYIETVTVCSDLTLICNEEGRLRDMPYNCTILGIPFYGPVFAVGVRGDEFRSLKGADVPFVLKMMRSDKSDDDK